MTLGKNEDKNMENMIEDVRENFIRASLEFGFKFESPYCLDEKEGLYSFGYMPDYGSEKGAVIMIGEGSDLECDERVDEYCNKNDILLSILNPEFYGGEYKKEKFEDILENWKI